MESANFVADNELGRINLHPVAWTHSYQSRHGELSKSVSCYSESDSSQLASLTTEILNFPALRHGYLSVLKSETDISGG
jgi:hypothetical protein